MNKERIYELLKKYGDGSASREEVRELLKAMESPHVNEWAKEYMTTDAKNLSSLPLDSEPEWERMWNSIKPDNGKKGKLLLFSRTWMKITASAAVLSAIGIGIYLLAANKPIKKETTLLRHDKSPIDIAPGGNKATLQLADGTVITLDSMENGSLAQQGGTRVIKLNSGQLSYNKDGKAADKILFNTISTPRGGQYRVVLSDGTSVWLNAASSLHFPTAFVGNERSVELTGEAYFEVARNKAMPFHVKVNGTDVMVTGTHFNIMAYGDEQNMQTTLLEGKVSVTPVNGKQERLDPGRQAIIDNNTHAMKMTQANLNMVMAWKNGFFHFRETNIRDVMRQLQRWYDVDVEYETKGTEQDFTGIIPRAQYASSILKTLELTGTVHFRIVDKKIIVLP